MFVNVSNSLKTYQNAANLNRNHLFALLKRSNTLLTRLKAALPTLLKKMKSRFLWLRRLLPGLLVTAIIFWEWLEHTWLDPGDWSINIGLDIALVVFLSILVS